MTFDLVPLCLWREARGGGIAGMTAVACCIRNRADRHHQTFEQVVMAPWAFSSMTAPHDPQINHYPTSPNPADWQTWLSAESITAAICAPAFLDVTLGATLYYDISIPFPAHWDHTKVAFTVKIGRLMFWKEL